MIIVTGAAGFIGSNLVKGLNQSGYKNIIAVDDLTDGTKFINLVDCEIADYLDKDVFLKLIEENASSNFLQEIKVIFHQGACSATTEWNGRFMLQNNYDYSKSLLHFCIKKNIPFIYASSAAVYGSGKIFKENIDYEKPLNVYGYSKFLFDQYVRKIFPNINNQVVGLRYFNVYGQREQHKGSMASVAWHAHNQIISTGEIKLFVGSDGYGNGEQQRDFIYVDDVIAVNLWFWQNQNKSGIFNLGTGHSQTFNDVAQAVIKWHQHGKINYIPFPEHLVGRYQSFTQADITALRAVGYQQEFLSVETGVKRYLDWLSMSSVTTK